MKKTNHRVVDAAMLSRVKKDKEVQGIRVLTERKLLGIEMIEQLESASRSLFSWSIKRCTTWIKFQ